VASFGFLGCHYRDQPESLWVCGACQTRRQHFSFLAKSSCALYPFQSAGQVRPVGETENRLADGCFLVYATLPYALKLANLGLREAVLSDNALAKGVNVYAGRITNQPVAQAFGLDYTPLSQLIS